MRETEVVEQRLDECPCPFCGAKAMAHNKLETRLLHGLDKDFAVMYSIMSCGCGKAFASYDADEYPEGDIYMPEVKQYVRHLRFMKRLSWTEISRRMSKEHGLSIALNSIRNWCKEK